MIHKYLFILSGLFEVAHMYLFSVFQGVQKCQPVFEVTYVFQSWPVLERLYTSICLCLFQGTHQSWPVFEVAHMYLFISVSGYTPALACI